MNANSHVKDIFTHPLQFFAHNKTKLSINAIRTHPVIYTVKQIVHECN